MTRRFHPCVRMGLVLTLAFLIPVGCSEGDGLPRQEITGSVLFDGKPLATGSIQFQPGGGPGEGSVGAGAVIQDGKYQIDREKGLTPGSYRVVILSHDSSIQPVQEDVPGGGVRLAPELIPPQYNVKTTLTAEVVAEKPNVFDYDLQKK
ncbi:hypothetical protein [Paludisphaera rhizosphaerae]|uniref:hypothetical protein n=1 Tax=Paludisphaera rhizosphaerae TaxID=2711216 RepID=UPI0013EC8DF0|nr:hypothetical protein [Paludisphaera rhizosphaerae]